MTRYRALACGLLLALSIAPCLGAEPPTSAQRLRDAIAEMDDVLGAQTHRSWWVARAAIADGAGLTRSREIPLTNGLSAPVARDSVDRLRQSGFLPD